MRRKLQKIPGPGATSIYSVIPSEIVEDMGLKPGDKLDWRIENNRIIAIPVHPSAKMNVQEAVRAPSMENEHDRNNRII